MESREVIAMGIDAATKTGWAQVERANGRETLLDWGVLNLKTQSWFKIHKLAREHTSQNVVAIELPWLGKDPHAMGVLARICGRFEQEFEVGGAIVRVIQASIWQSKMLGNTRMGRDALKRLAVAWCRSNLGVTLPQDAADAAMLAVYALRFPA